MFVIRYKDSYCAGEHSHLLHPVFQKIQSVLNTNELNPTIYPVLSHAEITIARFKNNTTDIINNVKWDEPSIFYKKEDKHGLEQLLEHIWIQPLADFLEEISELIDNTYTVENEDSNVSG